MQSETKGTSGATGVVLISDVQKARSRAEMDRREAQHEKEQVSMEKSGALGEDPDTGVPEWLAEVEAKGLGLRDEDAPMGSQ